MSKSASPSQARNNITSGEVVTLLAISAHDDDHRQLDRILSRSNWRVHHAKNRLEMNAIVQAQPISVILCDQEFSDGDWKTVLREIVEIENPPLLVITTREDDDVLWAEVLNLGGYDVLLKPLDANEVIRIMSLAWLCWRERAKRRAANQLLTLRAAG